MYPARVAATPRTDIASGAWDRDSILNVCRVEQDGSCELVCPIPH